MSDHLAAALALDASVTCVTGVSQARAAALSRMGIRTVRELLANYPRRYLDMSKVSTIAAAAIDEPATIVATIYEVKLKRPRPRFELVEVTLVDGTGTLIATFFRQPWLVKTLAAGMRVSVAGTLEFNYGFKRMTMPFLDVLDEATDAVEGKIIPIHPATEKVPVGQMRRIIANAIDGIGSAYDPLPLFLRRRYRLMSRACAMRSIHFPRSAAEQRQARRRLAYEEVLLLELHLMRTAAHEDAAAPARAHAASGKATARLRQALPFSLTDEQEAAVADISARMQTPSRMRHMLLGDVGTGKTIVAGFACACVADTGTQVLMMGPTEVLAEQYAASLGPLFDAAGISWALLTGSTPVYERESILEGAATGAICVLFGTHALLEADVVCRDCTLAIIDEEQRFGVGQRQALIDKGPGCDVLSMTATPIPRSLALTLYGTSTLSYLRSAPGARPPRTTKVYGFRERGRAYDVALEACARGEQVYVVCPLVGEKQEKAEGKKGSSKASAANAEDDEPVVYIDTEADIDAMSSADLKTAQGHADFLQSKTFSAYRVGLLHGRMKPEEKRQVMEQFRAHDIDVLVSTTVIEVGVDVPNATVMIVEDADRFGLSQLHQLRGRVGRGDKAGYVCLVASTASAQAAERLAAMERTDDGFKLAEYDLSLRREGDILGNRQHGASSLKLVNVANDAALIEAAHADAAEVLARPDAETDPALAPLFHEVDVLASNADEKEGR